MIVINSSIPKSASALILNYQRHIIKFGKSSIGQNQIDKYSYGFFEKIDLKVFLLLIYTYFRYGDFAIKTHGSPNFFIKSLVNSGLAKASFSYRDLRDVILSAIDHGERSRKGLDSTMAFHDITDIEEGLEHVKSWIPYWYNWKNYNKAFFIRYENLMQNKVKYIRKLADYLGYELNDDQIMRIYNSHEIHKDKIATFNKGTSERYKTEMTKKELSLCNSSLSQILVDMGYEV